MKLPESDVSVQSDLLIKEEFFSIGNPAIVFEILRNKLYNNPIGAICREITANARDAHREAGIPNRPIEITFPNNFDMTFKVRDFGPGISPERMSEVFVKFGNSTKREDNVQAGGFGLGAKVPFAYTDSFTIISVTEGCKRIYTAFIDETKIGKIALTHESKTDEPNGTVICIPVQGKDTNDFISEVFYWTSFWNPKPIFHGTKEEPGEIETLSSGTGWRTFKEKRSHHSRNFPGLLVSLDGVPYPLDHTFRSHIKNINDTSILDRPIILECAIGEVSVSASRDTLQYDQKTINVILNKIQVFRNEIDQVVTEKIKGCESYIEACQVAAGFAYISSNRAGISKFSWQDHKLVDNIRKTDVGTHARIVTYQSGMRASHLKPISFSDSGVVVYHNDCDLDSISEKVRQTLFEKHPKKTIQIIFTPSSITTHGVRETPVYRTKLLDLIDNKLSSICKRKARRIPAVLKNSTKVRYYTISNYNSKLKVESTNNKSPVVYGELQPHSLCISDGNTYIFSNFREQMEFSSFIGKPVYFVDVGQGKNLPDGSMSIADAWSARLKQDGVDPKELKHLVDDLDRFNQSSSGLLKILVGSSKIPEVQSHIDHFDSLKSKTEKYSKYLDQMSFMNHDMNSWRRFQRSSESIDNLNLRYLNEKDSKLLGKYYPMLPLIGFTSRESTPTIKNYIALVEAEYSTNITKVAS